MTEQEHLTNFIRDLFAVTRAEGPSTPSMCSSPQKAK